MANYTVDEIVKLYKAFSKVPAPIRASLVPRSNELLQLFVDWTQRDLERSENIRAVKTYLLDSKTLRVVSTSQAVDITSEQFSSLTCAGESRAVIRKILTKKAEEKCFLEVWKASTKIVNLDLQALELHGKVYEDGQFGCLNWSRDNKRLLYVAEKKRPKCESYFKVKPSDPGSSSSGEPKQAKEEGVKGTENMFIEDWGEGLVGKHHPVVCCVDLGSNNIHVLEGLPEEVSPGQPEWTPDSEGVVCVGWWHEPRRLGVTYCTNRRSTLFHLKRGKKEYVEIIGSQCKSIHLPRFSPDGTRLVFLESDAGGPHHKASRLMMCSWPNVQTSVVVEITRSDKDSGFPGLYIKSLPKRIWCKDSKRVVLHTQWRSRQVLVCVNTDSGIVQKLSDDDAIGSWTLLDIWEDHVVAACSSPDRKPYVVIGKLPEDSGKEAISWVRLDLEETTPPVLVWNIMMLQPPQEYVNPRFKDLKYEVIVIKPVGFEGHIQEVPLILWPHGGPHVAHVAGYQLFTTLFAKLGFASALVNYRGSEGFGEDNLKSLPGNIGTQDVMDCQHAVETLVEEHGFNPKKMVVFGGSHGGFLAAHMIGQFPKFYKACICRNPVIDLTSKLGISDIPDWSWVEIGLPYDFKSQAEPSVLKAMWEKSPIRYIDQMCTPTLILMGKIDLRVPPSQSIQFFHALKARNVPVRLHAYEDNHALSKVDVEADVFVNSVQWFFNHLNIDTSTTAIKL